MMFEKKSRVIEILSLWSKFDQLSESAEKASLSSSLVLEKEAIIRNVQATAGLIEVRALRLSMCCRFLWLLSK